MRQTSDRQEQSMGARATATVLMPIPAIDFDPTEVAVSWKILCGRGHRVVFATPDGARGHADPRMLTGRGLDLWGWIPGLERLPLLGLALRANGDARRAYRELERDPAFLSPLRHADVRPSEYDGLLVPGGHCARGMRGYLESPVLHRLVAAFFDDDRPVGAVCHGVVLVARSWSQRTGRSVLYGRLTTGLTWKLEQTAWRMMQFAGRVWDAGYYRTYREAPGEPAGYRSVEGEVSRVLARPSDFIDVQTTTRHAFRKGSGLFRDTERDDRPALVVVDHNYVSARWPGDVHTFAKRFAEVLENPRPQEGRPDETRAL